MKVTRHIGNCQICEKDFKLTGEGYLVHHGYRRPGDGALYGSCPGVDHVPYERGTDALREFADRLVEAIGEAENRLHDLKTGKITKLRVQRGRSAIEVSEGEPLWRRALEGHIQTAESAIKNLRREQDRVRRRICDWVERPLRTVEEETRKEERAKSEKREEREQKRAEREAKRRESERKIAERTERRKRQRQAYEERIAELAQNPDAKAKREAAKLTKQLERQLGEDFPWANDWDLSVVDNLIDLGVMYRDYHGNAMFHQ